MFVGYQVAFPSASVFTFSPVATPAMITMKSWTKINRVAKYIPSWAQPYGALLLFVIWSVLIRVPTKRIVNIGQNATVPIQLSMVFVRSGHSMLVHSRRLMRAQAIK